MLIDGSGWDVVVSSGRCQCPLGFAGSECTGKEA